MSIKGMGYSLEVDCIPLEWGRVIIPYTIWLKLVSAIKQFKENEFELSAENGLLVFHRIKIRNPEIRVTNVNNIFLDIPIDATDIEVISHAFCVGIDKVEESGNFHLVHNLMIEIRNNVDKAYNNLNKYGVTKGDLIKLLANRLEIQNEEIFFEMLLN